MDISYTLSKADEINLRKYNIKLYKYKEKINKIINIMFNMDELKKEKIFNSKISKVKFDIAFCNDNTIKTINKDYRNKDCPTDVITFSLFYDDNNSIIYRKTADLGQIIISVETANKQKKDDNIESEILTLIIHGILHLIGFDHLTKKDYDFVVGIQNKVLGEL